MFADANRAAQAAEALARQQEERRRLQDALKCEGMRMAALNAATQSNALGDASGGECDASESQGAVTLSRIGRGKLLKVEGQVLLHGALARRLTPVSSVARLHNQLPRLRRLGTRVALHPSWHKQLLHRQDGGRRPCIPLFRSRSRGLRRLGGDHVAAPIFVVRPHHTRVISSFSRMVYARIFSIIRFVASNQIVSNGDISDPSPSPYFSTRP